MSAEIRVLLKQIFPGGKRKEITTLLGTLHRDTLSQQNGHWIE